MIEPKYIDTAAQCNVKTFEQCCFFEKYDGLIVSGEVPIEVLKEAFEKLYVEYIDLSGLFITRQYELYVYINSIYNRIQTVDNFIALQKAFIREFSVPYVQAFKIINGYGHGLIWRHGESDLDWFMKKLDKVELKEKRWQTEIEIKTAELMKMQENKSKGVHDSMQNRKQWLSMITKLQQNRYVIDKNVTMMDEIAIMISDSRDMVEEQKLQAKK